jgi:hypothetical protein
LDACGVGSLGLGWPVSPDTLLQDDHFPMEPLHPSEVRRFRVIEQADLDICVVAFVEQCAERLVHWNWV